MLVVGFMYKSVRSINSVIFRSMLVGWFALVIVLKLIDNGGYL